MDARPRHSSPIIVLTALLLAASAAMAAAPSQDQLRATLFAGADEALKSANDNHASLLAPESYAAGAEAYRRGESILESGGGIEAIQRNLARAQSEFARAAAAAHAARQTFASALEARSDAVNAEAERYTVELWREAEETMTEASERLERGREDSAKRLADDAEARYRTAELEAIQANYLNGTRSLLDTADDLRAGRHAPISYQRAKDLLAEAETSITGDRYDTDRPRNLAQSAEHNAHHAIYVSRLERRIRGNETTLEQILLDWEAAVSRVADQVDVPVYFDDGHEDAVKKITRAIDALKADISFLEQGIADRDAQIASLQLEVGGQSQSLNRINDALARREQERERFERVETLFEPDEATVLRRSDSVILRLIGLNFASGSARLAAEHDGILANVQRALAEFPEANVVVEGHTDSFGSDADNQDLSQARANAVQEYLLANAPISPANIQALGYGESRPVANNETPEGRLRNRRIDIIVYPRM